jgi:hypothetical protein
MAAGSHGRSVTFCLVHGVWLPAPWCRSSGYAQARGIPSASLRCRVIEFAVPDSVEEVIPFEPAEHADPSVGVAGQRGTPPGERASVDAEFLAGGLGGVCHRSAVGLRATATKNEREPSLSAASGSSQSHKPADVSAASAPA